MRKLALFATFLLLSIQAFAQNVVVKGVVKDANGEPVVGAAVMQDGTQNITITDIDGNYSIKVPPTAKLSVSCVGFSTFTAPVDGRTTLDVILEIDSQVLEDVIVVAFGTATKESFTGSATVVSSEKIGGRQVNDPLTALNGQVAGLQMTEGNGPNSNPSLLVRGFGSINAGNDPLIVVDGFPFNGYWSDINPQDVESISVLKDAASNALYGARGANGVIMITTKSAKRGQATITFDAKWGINTDGRVYYDYVDDPQEYYEDYYKLLFAYYSAPEGGNNKYAAARNKALETMGKSSGDNGLGYIVYSVPEGQVLITDSGKLNPKATLGNVINYKGKSYTLLPDNWKDYGLRNGVRKEYNLNINGGTDQFKFLASIGYVNNLGLSYGSDNTRFTARAKADYQARKWLKVGANMTFTKTEGNYNSSAFSAVYEMSPIYPLFIRDGEGNIMTDSHGKMFDYGDGQVNGLVRPIYKNENPLQSDVLYINNNDSNAFGLQGYADITLLPGLVFTVNGSVYDTENRMKYASNPFYGYFANTGGYVWTGHYRTYSMNLQQLLKYDHSFDGHNVSAMIGHEYYLDEGTSLDATKTQVFAYEINTELDGSMIKSTIGGSASTYNTEGYFTRVQYDYMSKYFASASYRRDGSSKFAPEHRWGNFWSLGGAWIVSKENWFDAPVFDMLKLKASYGVQGNDGITSYSYTRKYNIDTVNSLPAATFKSEGNRDITWESNGNLNAGVEFELLKRRVNGGLEYYYRKTSDMLLWKSVPLSMGYSGYYDNIGDMVNQGLELNLSAALIQTDNITWSVDFNISHNNNCVTYLPDSNKSSNIDGYEGYLSGYRYVGEGLPLYTWYLKKYAGVNQENGKSQWYYTDSNGELQKTTQYDSADYYLCGSPHPVVYGGLGTSLYAFGFDFSINLLYSVGGLAYDWGYNTLMTLPYSQKIGYNMHRDLFKGWTKENPSEDIPRAQFGDYDSGNSSDRWLIDASSLTLKNISIGYTFPSKMIKKLNISSLRFYASCENIAYWSHRDGFDPRTSLTGSVSGSGYSPMRTVSGGLTIKF